MTALAEALSRLIGNDVDVETLWTVTLLSVVTLLSGLCMTLSGLDFGSF